MQHTQEFTATYSPWRDALRSFGDVWRRFRKNTTGVIGLVLVAIVVVAAVSSAILGLYHPDLPIHQNLDRALLPPSWTDPFGTDHLGRDVLMRVLFGSQVSIVVGFTAVAVGMSLGMILGITAGYFGGWWDTVVMRMVDILLALPFFLMAIAIAGVLGVGLTNTILALGIASFPTYTRLVRGNVLALRQELYVDAARVLGASPLRIMVTHIAPNLLGTLIVYGTLRVSTAILAESGLSFLGLGTTPPTPTWGNMLSDGREYILFFGWLPLFPGLAILLTVVGFNLLGDGLRDALDPKSRNR